MRCRSWHAAKESQSPCARLTINTVAEGPCSQCLPEGLSLPAGTSYLPPGNEECSFAHSLKQARGCRLCSSLPLGFHTTIPMGEKGSVLCLALDTISEEKSDLERGSFLILSMQYGGKSHVCSTGGFLDQCWVHASFVMPIFVNSPLVQFLGKTPGRSCSNGMGRYMHFYRNHNTNYRAYSSLH